MKVRDKNIKSLRFRRNTVVNLVLILVVLLCVLPIVLLVTSSLTDNKAIINGGYRFIPLQWSTEAYSWLWEKRLTLVHAFGMTIGTTVFGTAAGLCLTAMLAYALSQKKLPGRKVLQFMVTFTLLFNGGLVPWYFVYTQVLPLKNSVWALIIPNLLVSGFQVMLMRTFFSTTVPGEILESGRIDGAGEFRIFLQVVLPISLPILATVGMLKFIDYFNSWYNSMVLTNKDAYDTLQSYLSRTLLNIQYLASANAGGGVTNEQVEVPMESVRMAMAVIGVAPLLLIYPFFQKYLVTGLTVGAVKG